MKDTRKTVATDIEMFRKLLDSAQCGDNVGVLLRGTKKEEVERGMVLAKPGCITPHTKFKAEVYVLSKEEGGRHTPFFTNYRPQFYFRTSDVTGTVTLAQGVEMVMPGDNVSVEITLIAPVAMEKGQRFAIREGGRTIGAGRVAKSSPKFDCGRWQVTGDTNGLRDVLSLVTCHLPRRLRDTAVAQLVE